MVGLLAFICHFGNCFIQSLLFTDNPNLTCKRQMDQLQERIQCEFVQALTKTMGGENNSQVVSSRIARLTLRLLPLKTFLAGTMEELFFAGLIGNVQIDNIIPYILRMETAEYNMHMAGQTLNVPTPSLSQVSMTASSTSVVPVAASGSATDHTGSIISQLSASVTNINGGSSQ